MFFRNYCRHERRPIPYRLEYSSKDDKFRLITGFRNKPLTVNLSRIDSVHLLAPWEENEYSLPHEQEEVLVMDLYDTRNALERAMGLLQNAILQQPLQVLPAKCRQNF